MLFCIDKEMNKISMMDPGEYRKGIEDTIAKLLGEIQAYRRG
jgi:hypothetical protein